ncbi:MAG: 4'-phosphopantetheinyl transferase [Gammaproteobacteria bacterium]|nr:MAG: 4'-phosphopantetheinyl transferase [Gammaproteobacteria bacterium]
MDKIKQNQIVLSDSEVHLWFVKPQDCLDPALLESYKALLTKEETTKQQRYIFEKDRHDALITRAFVRHLLSCYMDLPPSDWRFSKGEQGKPELINPTMALRFNISHTKHLIICALTLNHDVGCDVEHIDRKSDVLAIADRFFSKIETKELFSLPESEQRQRFFDYWTLKESYIKAWGQGLAIPLKDFSFHIGRAASNDCNNNIRLSFVPEREDNADLWQSWLFYPGPQHRIALSVKNIADLKGDRGPLEPYRVRFFESTPLVNFKEVEAINS